MSGEVCQLIRRKTILLISLAVIAWAILIPACAYSYTVFQLGLGRLEGVFPSPEEGMRSRLEKSYIGIQDIQIEHAGPNSFDGSNPHIWFVTARVFGEQRRYGSRLPPTGDYPGSFFLKVHDGWIHRPEGSFPEAIGFFMKVFHMEGL
jgi:hypothetical protein